MTQKKFEKDAIEAFAKARDALATLDSDIRKSERALAFLRRAPATDFQTLEATILAHRLRLERARQTRASQSRKSLEEELATLKAKRKYALDHLRATADTLRQIRSGNTAKG